MAKDWAMGSSAVKGMPGLCSGVAVACALQSSVSGASWQWRKNGVLTDRFHAS